jgi:hypothetical protein
VQRFLGHKEKQRRKSPPPLHPSTMQYSFAKIPIKKERGDVVHQREDIQFLHLYQKHKYVMMLMRYNQLPVSKVYEMSSLMNKDETFSLCKSLTTW